MQQQQHHLHRLCLQGMAASCIDDAAAALQPPIRQALICSILQLPQDKHGLPTDCHISWHHDGHCRSQVSQYLEGYLWPNFDAAASSDAHVLSIIIMVNDKFREGVAPWTCFHTRKVCAAVFHSVKDVTMLLTGSSLTSLLRRAMLPCCLCSLSIMAACNWPETIKTMQSPA